MAIVDYDHTDEEDDIEDIISSDRIDLLRTPRGERECSRCHHRCWHLPCLTHHPGHVFNDKLEIRPNVPAIPSVTWTHRMVANVDFLGFPTTVTQTIICRPIPIQLAVER